MITKAHKTMVRIGTAEIEGYLSSDGKTFGMSQTQVIVLSGVTKDTSQASKRYIEISKTNVAKTLVPSGFVVHRKVEIEGQSERVNLVELESVSPFLTVCLALGHIDAARPLALFSGAMLHQLFCDAFGLKFEVAERQEYLRQRMESKDFYFDLSGEISSWYDRTKATRTQPLERYFSNTFDAINIGLFDKKSKKIREELGVNASNQLIRDYFNNEALRRITQIQSIAANQMRSNKDLRPVDAVKLALKSSLFDVIDYSNEV